MLKEMVLIVIIGMVQSMINNRTLTLFFSICSILNLATAQNINKLFLTDTVFFKSCVLITLTESEKTASFIADNFEMKDSAIINNFSYEMMIKNGYYYYLNSYSFSNLLGGAIVRKYFTDKNIYKKSAENKEKNSANIDEKPIYKSNRITIQDIDCNTFLLVLIDADKLNQFVPMERLKSDFYPNIYIKGITPLKIQKNKNK